jgi:hypothetical protein
MIENDSSGIERAEERPAAHFVASRHQTPSRAESLLLEPPRAFQFGADWLSQHGMDPT